MPNAPIDDLLKLIQGLSVENISLLRKAVVQKEEQVQGSLVYQEKTESVTECPHCGFKKFIKNGQKDGRQRFKCMNPVAEPGGKLRCGKTFNALTGTALARLRMADKHLLNAECMSQGLSIPKTAKKLGVSWDCAFRWRHRFLTVARSINPEMLSGIVEADETFFIESFKGSVPVGRPAKKRGTPASKPGLSFEQIPVLVARDRATKATLTAVLPSRKAVDIGKELLPRLALDAVLCSDGASAYRIIAMTKGIEVKSTPAKLKKTAGNYHINNVNAYDSRLKSWIYRFHGVATRYLPSYLAWHRMLDAASGEMPAKQFLKTALG